MKSHLPFWPIKSFCTPCILTLSIQWLRTAESKAAERQKGLVSGFGQSIASLPCRPTQGCWATDERMLWCKVPATETLCIVVRRVAFFPSLCCSQLLLTNQFCYPTIYKLLCSGLELTSFTCTEEKLMQFSRRAIQHVTLIAFLIFIFFDLIIQLSIWKQSEMSKNYIPEFLPQHCFICI